MRKNSLILAATVCAIAGAIAHADWNPGDAHKMHFPQLPDPFGWDVNMTFPQFVADDWRCSESGPVNDVHFWFSYEHDQIVAPVSIHLSIHSDIPATPTSYSRPGPLLWERDFPVTPGTGVSIRPYGTGEQGWADPKSGTWRRPDHMLFYQANIVDIANPFFQELGTIYWLDISVVMPAGANQRIGWKTSIEHFNDDATWAHLLTPGAPMDWMELRDPTTQQSLDMAFVITPAPGSLALLGTFGLIAARRRRNT